MRAKATAPQIATSLTRTTPISGSSKPNPGPFMALLTAAMLGLTLTSETYSAICTGVE